MTAPNRWVDASKEGTAEARGAELIRGWGAPEPLSPRALARIRVGLGARGARRWGTRGKTAAWILGLAGASLAFAAAARYAGLFQQQPVPIPAPVRRGAPPAPALSELPPTPAVAQPKPASRPTHPTVAVRAPEPTTPSEAALLSQALAALHQQSDPAGALRALDAYDLAFPAGQMRAEARITRLDALLAAGRRSEALALLEGVDPTELSQLPRAQELALTHAELLASAGRCEAALALFEGESERALYGRGSCLATLGRFSEARVALERYLELFPQGRFAPAARTALHR